MGMFRKYLLLSTLFWIGEVFASPVTSVQLPFVEGTANQCTQNSNDTPTHDGNSTFYDLDFGMLVGTKIMAAASGVVYRESHAEFGNYIRLVHDNDGYWTIYAHLSEYIASHNSHVNVGDEIALSGGAPGTPGAGTSTAPHLHFGVHDDSGVGKSRPMGVYAFDRNTNVWGYLSTESHMFKCDTSSSNKDGHRYEARPMYCSPTQEECQIKAYGNFGWYPPISNCSQASQWFLLDSGQNIIGSGNISGCSQIPAACYP